VDTERQRSAGLRPPCPECGADDALILCGKQEHHPPRWLRWLAVIMHLTATHIYTCRGCGVTVALAKIQERGRKW
jgi:hypothetical protein